MSAFPSIRIEGGLLGPEVLDRIAAGEMPGQKPVDFGLEPRRNLTDEIAAVFADARALWGVFQHRLDRIPPDDAATTPTRDAWVIPFLGLLGHELRYNPRAYEIDGLTFAISHHTLFPFSATEHKTSDGSRQSPPVHVVGARQDLGRLAPSGRPRLAPHSLVQEYLNRTEQVWGIVTNGLTLRLLRDSTFVRRQAYVEFDLVGIMEEQRFADFAALYRLLHRSRLPHGLMDAGECFLEQYYVHSVEQGGRVREHLRDGVQASIEILADGFLAHPANKTLRDDLKEGRLNAQGMYRQILRIIYRFLFLLVAEDRGLISADPLYRGHYGVGRLRNVLGNRGAFSDHEDLWYGLTVLWHVFCRDELAPCLGIAPLNGELFAPQSLDGCSLSNRNLLEAFRHLAWYRESPGAPLRRVNYAALDVEELGSVYESLLEFHPVVEEASPGRPGFALVSGSERKTTGSYYTPPELVNELVQSALVPVMSDRLKTARKPEDKERAVLSLKVCDPACGSGHFLLAASRRLGKELARIRTGEDEPSPERVRDAVRDVISHCIYGVDKNPLAVDLCRVALWIESHTEGKPLTFLDHRIRCGDSLVGVFDLSVLGEGIPDRAFDPLEGDDRAVARDALRHNRDERAGQLHVSRNRPEAAAETFPARGRELDGIADDTPEQIRRKKALFEAQRREPAWVDRLQACDLWTAAFFQRLVASVPVITSRVLSDHQAGRPVDPRFHALAGTLAYRHGFFHWPLEFPEVLADGGFDVVLSNPPWERIKLQEQEFFAARDTEIANAPTKAIRGRLIRELPERNPALHEEFVEALRAASASSAFLRHGARYPLTGRGDINTYAVFSELARGLLKAGGRAGIIVPSGIATDDTTKFFFRDVAGSGSLVSLFDFENRKKLFPAIDSRIKFCLFTCADRKEGGKATETADLVFFALGVQDLRDSDRHFTLSSEEILLLNPNTGNCPVFRNRADAELTKAVYRRVPILWREATGDRPEENPWRLSFRRLFDMANDSHHFRAAEKLEAEGCRREGNVFVSRDDRYLPLYEAKMLHQFDHRWATYEKRAANVTRRGAAGDRLWEARDVTLEEKRDPSFVVQPRHWVREDAVESVVPKYPEPLDLALRLKDRASVQRVLCLWAAGHHLNRGDEVAAGQVLERALGFGIDRAVAKFFSEKKEREAASEFEKLYPLTGRDAADIVARLESPEEVAAELIRRFSPKWFLGWRDICRSTDERTLIMSVVPRSPVGHTFPLAFFSSPSSNLAACFVGFMNSFIVDYAARQKVGGTHVTYGLLKQFPIFPPDRLDIPAGFAKQQTIREWILSRVLELVYTAHDLAPLARDCGYAGPPFPWNEERRFEIRCELDAAVFHLYLPCEANGDWRFLESETPAERRSMLTHFPSPRHAVAYVMEQFPIVKGKDEKTHGSYRTKGRILEIYDAMLEARRTGRPYRSKLEK